MEVGKRHHLEVVKEVSFGWYLLFNYEEILLPAKYAPEGLKPRDTLEVFVYRDSDDRLVATTEYPLGELNDFVALEVKDTNQFGAFMDWGLSKDLFVPFKEQHLKMEEGKVYVVRICLDFKTDRLIGVSKLNAFFERDFSELTEGQEVDLLIYGQTDLGMMAVVDNRWSGLLYQNELFQKVKVGDKLKGYIKKLREDEKMDLTLRPPGIEAIKSSKEVILMALEQEGGFLPYHDKSNPEDIRERFGMSKKDFKKAIGGLYKEGEIQIQNDGLHKIG